MMRTGKHILAQLHGCPRDLVETSKVVLKLLNEVVSEAKLTKVGELSHQFEPVGATAIILLGESHMSAHTWPEKNGLVAVDIFTCGNEGDADEAIKVVINKFKPQKVEKQTIDR